MVTANWFPIHHSVTGDERLDGYAKAVAEGKTPRSEALNQYRWETSLIHEQGRYRGQAPHDRPVDI